MGGPWVFLGYRRGIYGFPQVRAHITGPCNYPETSIPTPEPFERDVSGIRTVQKEISCRWTDPEKGTIRIQEEQLLLHFAIPKAPLTGRL